MAKNPNELSQCNAHSQISVTLINLLNYLINNLTIYYKYTIYLAYRWENFVKNVKHTQSIKIVHVAKTGKNSVCCTGWKFSTNN